MQQMVLKISQVENENCPKLMTRRVFLLTAHFDLFVEEMVKSREKKTVRECQSHEAIFKKIILDPQ